MFKVIISIIVIIIIIFIKSCQNATYKQIIDSLYTTYVNITPNRQEIEIWPYQLLPVPPQNLDAAARRFSVAAPRLWNSLPLNCRTAPSVDTFKTFFFDSA